MKLENATAKRIASLINSYETWSRDATRAIDAGDYKKHEQYREWRNDALIDLYKEFGIELPNLTSVLAERLEKAA
jgi:hypothetical protein